MSKSGKSDFNVKNFVLTGLAVIFLIGFFFYLISKQDEKGAESVACITLGIEILKVAIESNFVAENVIECELNKSRKNASIWIDTSSKKALQICRALLNYEHEELGYKYEGWRIKIFSPFSGDRPIAVCGRL